MAKPWRPRLLVFAGLHEKPQVKQIAKHTGADPNRVVGALLRVWLKFQADGTEAGELTGKTADWLDGLAELPGLAAGMAAAHWLYIHHNRIMIPAFDEFVSKKAIKRLENALHMAGLREVKAAGNAGDKSDIPPHTATPGHKVPAGPAAPKKRAEKPAADGRMELFDRFWAAYPKKVAKRDAVRAWLVLKDDVTEELLVRMVAAIGRQSRSDQWVKDNGQFIPYPATWLNRRRWEDEPDSLGAGKRVLPPGRVPPGEGEYGRKRSYGEAEGGPVPPGPEAGLF